MVRTTDETASKIDRYIGTVIRRQRKKLGMAPQDLIDRVLSTYKPPLASDTSFSEAELEQFELGERTVPPIILVHIGQALGVNIDGFYPKIGITTTSADAEAELITIMATLSDRGLERLRSVAQSIANEDQRYD